MNNTTSDFYLLRELCIDNYLKANIFNSYIISHRNELLIQNNMFKYGDDIYINIKTFYKLALICNKFNVFEKLIDNLDITDNIFTNISKPLRFNTKYYVYIFNCFTKLKIGYSSHIINRLRAISRDTNTTIECLAMFEYDTKKEAYLVEQMLLSKFEKYIVKGEYLSNSPGIVNDIKRLLGNRIIPIFTD